MRKINLPKAPKLSGRHSSGERAKRGAEAKYKGSHRKGKGPDAKDPFWYRGEAAKAEAAKAAKEEAAPRRRRVTPLIDRPGAVTSPRSRFKNADQTKARIDYERRQRDELRAQQKAGGGRLAAAAPSRGRAGTSKPTPARSRFPGGPSDAAEYKRTAAKLGVSPTARGTARRPSSDIRDPHAIPGQRVGTHRRDPKPELSGRGFAGAYFGQRPGKD